MRECDKNGAGAREYAALIGPVAELHARGRLRDGFEVQSLADTVWTALAGIVSLKLTCPRVPATPIEALVETSMRALLDGSLRESPV